MVTNKTIFQDEINAEKAIKAAQKERTDRQIWKDRLVEQNFVKTARDPKQIIDLYEYDAADRAMVQRARQSFQTKQAEFVDAYEQAYFQHRGELPMSFWMEFTPNELRMFGGGDLDDVASWVEDALAAQQAELEVQAEIERRFQAAVEGNDNAAAMADLPFVPGFGVLGFFLPDLLGKDSTELPDEEELRRVIELQVRGRGDELVEDEIAAFMESERRLLEAMRAGAPKPTALDDSQHFKDGKERYGGDVAERFYLSNGDPLSAEDHERFWESEVAFLESL